MPSGRDPILVVENLAVEFATDSGVLHAVRGVSFDIPRHRVVALLGESGCGKSVTGLSMLGLIEPPGRVSQGSIRYHRTRGESLELTALNPDGREFRTIRGGEIAMIFQEPRASLTPVYTVGEQISETIRLHRGESRAAARRRAEELLARVGIPAPRRVYDAYPHELSGGMCQRAMIAMALSCDPKLLIADEPTTALDVTIQAQILNLILGLRDDLGMSVLIITHDMGVVAEVADEVVVMYLGKIAERGSLEDVFTNPLHPYTRGLFASVPRPDSDPSKPLPRIAGSVPDLRSVPAGCPFRGRCPEEGEDCREMPPFFEAANGHEAACWRMQTGARTAAQGSESGR